MAKYEFDAAFAAMDASAQTKALKDRITRIGNREKVGKTDIQAACIESLIHYQQHGNVQPVNALLLSLTPANKARGIAYFSSCIPHKIENENKKFKGFAGKNHKIPEERLLEMAETLTIYIQECISLFDYEPTVAPSTKTPKEKLEAAMKQAFKKMEGPEFSEAVLSIMKGLMDE